MRVLISADGKHDPDGTHRVVVDNYGILIDLSGVKGDLHDPTIRRVEWAPAVFSGSQRESGTIFRQDGTTQPFFDITLVKPYVEAWKARRSALEAQQAAFKAAEQQAADKEASLAKAMAEGKMRHG